MQVIFSHSCPSQWVYHVWTMLTVGEKTHIWIKQKKWIWSFLTADIICHSQNQLRKWSWEENISGMSLFGSSWFKLDWEELKIFFFWTADCGVFSAVRKAKEVQINKGKHPRPTCIETLRCVLFITGTFTEANYSCIFPLTNVSLQQMLFLCQHLL